MKRFLRQFKLHNRGPLPVRPTHRRNAEQPPWTSQLAGAKEGRGFPNLWKLMTWSCARRQARSVAVRDFLTGRALSCSLVRLCLGLSATDAEGFTDARRLKDG